MHSIIIISYSKSGVQTDMYMDYQMHQCLNKWGKNGFFQPQHNTKIPYIWSYPTTNVGYLIFPINLWNDILRTLILKYASHHGAIVIKTSVAT
jgi:hypothetical protein